MDLHNPHDKFFKQIISNQENARCFIKTFFPKPLLKYLNLETLRHENNSYVNKELKAYFSDVVLRCRLNNNKNLKISILIEHKSYKDDRVAFQILNYLGQAYIQQFDESSNIDLIIPLLFYHDEGTWKLRNVPDFFYDFPKEFYPFLPAFEMIFVDVHRMEDIQIQKIRNLAIASMLITHKLKGNPLQLFKKIESIFENFALKEDGNFIQTLFVYNEVI